MMRRMMVGLGMIAAVAATAACGAEESAASAADQSSPATAVAAEAPAATAAEGNVIEVRMTMANGGAFEPAQVTAKQGDVIRFVNVENVHNISFPAAKNAAAGNLPAASPYLTTPGQTYDLTVDLAAGEYTFQCDPHAAMGMVGTLIVQ